MVPPECDGSYRRLGPSAVVQCARADSKLQSRLIIDRSKRTWPWHWLATDARASYCKADVHGRIDNAASCD